jgi:hypothetical protein
LKPPYENKLWIHGPPLNLFSKVITPLGIEHPILQYNLPSLIGLKIVQPPLFSVISAIDHHISWKYQHICYKINYKLIYCFTLELWPFLIALFVSIYSKDDYYKLLKQVKYSKKYFLLSCKKHFHFFNNYFFFYFYQKPHIFLIIWLHFIKL